MVEERTVNKEPPRLVSPWMIPKIERNIFCLFELKFFKYEIFFLFKLIIEKNIIINAI